MKMFTEAVAAFYAGRFGADFAPSEVAASCGGKQALFNAACTLLNPGDDVLIPKPYWVTFPEIATFCRANSVFIETESTDFVLTAEQVRNAITERSKLLIINSPSNPSGRVIPSEEMVRIIETCAEHNIYVLTDECYLFFAYPPGEVFTSASLPDELRRFVCVAGKLLKNIRNDRLAHWFHDRERRMDPRHRQTAKSFRNPSDIVRPIRLCPSDERTQDHDRGR
jgi:aspartate aminotransferase